LSEEDITKTEMPPSMLSPRSRKKLPKPTPEQVCALAPSFYLRQSLTKKKKIIMKGNGRKKNPRLQTSFDEGDHTAMGVINILFFISLFFFF